MRHIPFIYHTYIMYIICIQYIINSGYVQYKQTYVCLLLFYILDLRSCQDVYRLVAVCTRDDFIVLPHWEIRQSVPWPDIPLSHMILTPVIILLIPSTWLGSDKYQFYKSLAWFDHKFKTTVSPMQDPCSTDSSTTPGQISMVKPRFYTPSFNVNLDLTQETLHPQLFIFKGYSVKSNPDLAGPLCF